MKLHKYLRPAAGFVACAAFVACSDGAAQDSVVGQESLRGACGLRVTENVYDAPNAWGTITVENGGAAPASGLVVELDVPAGAHCTNDAVPAGATLSPLVGQGASASTASNHCTFAWTGGALAAGASQTFNYSTDSGAFREATNVVARSASCDGARPPGEETNDDGASTGRDAGSSTGDGVGNFPARFAAPYVETWNDNDLAALANDTGHKFYTLAFILGAGGACEPMWNGETSLTGNGYARSIESLRALGGDVIVSFGGASGTELGNACGSVAELQAAISSD